MISYVLYGNICYFNNFFSAHNGISVLNHLLLVSSADNLFKQVAPRSGPVKLSCENGAHVKSRMREQGCQIVFE